MKLDFDSLYSVSREEFQRDFDAILEQVQPTGPIIDATPTK